MLRNTSYRRKIPASLSITIVVTALVVAIPLITGANQAAKRDSIENALSLGKTLSRSLRPALVHDELWQAFEIIRTPFGRSAGVGPEDARQAIVLDSQDQIYVSTAPHTFPSTEALAKISPTYGALMHTLVERPQREPLVLEDIDPAKTFMVIPILAEDQTRLGTLVMTYSRSIFRPRFYETIRHAAVSTLIVLVILLPIGWLWGKRIAAPLLHLSDAIARIPHQSIDSIRFDPSPGKDEIASLSARFSEMLEELKQKALFEKEFIASERLAAIGRMTAGIAHEINNPLGGMLNAINTYRRHGADAGFTEKTVSLLERGLTQIKETVAALLMEARLESHALTPQDIEDTRTLIIPALQKRSVSLHWKNQLREPISLSSTEIRQILLNLLLNAGQAASDRGEVHCKVELRPEGLAMSVTNDGSTLTPAQLKHLFEPFPESRKGGKGLGLWMTYRLVTQLDGKIEVMTPPGLTRFDVLIPWAR